MCLDKNDMQQVNKNDKVEIKNNQKQKHLSEIFSKS